jgi:hypothetical protein
MHQKYANTRIQKLSNAFHNAQQMVIQLVTYIMFYLTLYHSSRTFEFINTSFFDENVFVLKSTLH